MKYLITFLVALSCWSYDIKIGYVEFYPYIYTNGDKLEGSIIDYSNEFFKDYDITWVKTPLARVDRSLNSDSIDLFINYCKSLDRQKLVEFANQSYFELTPAVCTISAPLPSKITEVISKEYNKVLTIKDGVDINLLFKSEYLVQTDTPIKSFENKAVQFLEKGRVDYVYFADIKTANKIVASAKVKIKCQAYAAMKNSLFMVTKKRNPLLNVINKKLEMTPKMSLK